MPARNGACSVRSSALGHRAPADGVEEGAEGLRVVPAVDGDLRQSGLGQHLAAGLDLPGDGQLAAEVVVTDAGQRDESAAGKRRGELVDGLTARAGAGDDPLLTADPDELARLRRGLSGRGGGHGTNLRSAPVLLGTFPSGTLAATFTRLREGKMCDRLPTAGSDPAGSL